jgi:hypothetical protein
MNPRKLILHFSDFSVLLYAIYKIQQKHLYYLRIVLQQGPWRFLFSYRNALDLQISPRKERGPRNAAPGRPAGAAPAKFRPGRRRAGRGRARGGVGGCPRPELMGWTGVEWPRRAALAAPERVATAVAAVPARGGRGREEASMFACVGAREDVGSADRREEPAEERRTAEAGGGSGQSGTQGDGGA